MDLEETFFPQEWLRFFLDRFCILFMSFTGWKRILRGWTLNSWRGLKTMDVFWNKCFCRSLGTADCTSAGWSLLQSGAQQVNHTEITPLALFPSVRAIPSLFLLPVLCVTLTDGALILPGTFCPLEIFFSTKLKSCKEFIFCWTPKALFLLLKQLKCLVVLQKVFHEIPTGGFHGMTQTKYPGNWFHFIPN